VQYFSGALGTILVGFFDNEEGVFHEADGETLGVQVLGLVVISAWAAFWSGVVFGIARVLKCSIPEEIQAIGLEGADIGWTGFQKSGLSQTRVEESHGHSHTTSYNPPLTTGREGYHGEAQPQQWAEKIEDLDGPGVVGRVNTKS
jgi:hypothetical protein